MEAGLQNGRGRGLVVADEREAEHGLGGELNARIARAVVRIYHGTCGRGPTKARAIFRGNVVAVVLEQVLTQAEKSLVATGRCDEVVALRRELHVAMRDELALAVGELTRCRVSAVMGDAQCEPDLAVEVFVLDQAVMTTPIADG
ncbi:MAG TPA: Na-translocating system protein MpsC family protein [Thermoleophilaceae bacterium]|nr:Na-translocating system protein MpsC family protein [Thermoleophilaceae bacterium]